MLHVGGLDCNLGSIASGVTAVGVTQLHLRTFAARSLRFGLTGLLRLSKSKGVEGLVN